MVSLTKGIATLMLLSSGAQMVAWPKSSHLMMGFQVSGLQETDWNVPRRRVNTSQKASCANQCALSFCLVPTSLVYLSSVCCVCCCQGKTCWMGDHRCIALYTSNSWGAVCARDPSSTMLRLKRCTHQVLHSCIYVQHISAAFSAVDELPISWPLEAIEDIV